MRMRYPYYQKRNFEDILYDTIYRLVNFVRQLTLVFLGIAIIFGGEYLNDWEDTQSKEALQSFLQGFSKSRYMDINDFIFDVPEGVTVHHLEEISYRTYEVAASAGNYTFKGTVGHGEFKNTIQYTQNEYFWDKGTMMVFCGEGITVLGITWVFAKYMLGIRFLRELRNERL